jgi:hypothetical protein
MNYQGYELFNDVEDAELRANNRAACLRNIFQAKGKAGKVGTAGLATMLGYLKLVPEQERGAVIALMGEKLCA